MRYHPRAATAFSHLNYDWAEEYGDELTFARLQWPFAGIGSFAHLKHVKCLTDPTELYDIAIVGAPFDTAVSYRPGTFPSLPYMPQRRGSCLACSTLENVFRLAAWMSGGPN